MLPIGLCKNIFEVSALPVDERNKGRAEPGVVPPNSKQLFPVSNETFPEISKKSIYNF